MKAADFLFELGCEELPAAELAPLVTHLKQSVQKALEVQKFQFSKIQTYYTPRRLAILIEELQLEKPAATTERKGPAKKAAFDAEGNPTKALEGFLKSCGVSVADVTELETEKGVWLTVKVNQPAVAAKTVLPEILTQAVKTLPIKKAMRWGDHDFTFLRPVHWIVSLLGEEIVPLTLFSLKAGADSFGHRFHHPGAVKLKQASDYKAALLKAHVMVDPEERHNVIVTDTNALVPQGMSAHFGRLNEVINLVEWPVVLLCHFEKEFLAVPKEVLIATMEANQRVFPIHDKAQNLQNAFVVIANIVSKAPEAVVHGNEKVVRARLSDAKFFCDEDLKTPLVEHLAALKKITFQQGLGSLFDKTKRLDALAALIGKSADMPNLHRAAELCKADLCTQMVQEFPELQGYVGHQYALQQGEARDVAEAIEDHYKPKGRGAALPRNPVGASLALVDKIDTLVGMFAIGKEPTSSGDPFALRRQALGVVAILIEKHIHIDLLTIFAQAYDLYHKQGSKVESRDLVMGQLQRFFKERFEVWCREEKGLPVSVVRAVLERQQDSNSLDFFDVYERIVVLQRLLDSEAGAALKELAKRIHNILGGQTVTGKLNLSLYEPAEQALYDILQTIPMWQQSDLESQYRAYLDLKDPIAAFFDAVLVNDEDVALRLNRQLLLQQARLELSKLADFSKL